MRTARLRLTAAATVALSAFAGVGLSAAADGDTLSTNTASTWTHVVTSGVLPTSARTIVHTEFPAGSDVGVWAVQDLLAADPASDDWSLKIDIGTPSYDPTGANTTLGKQYASVGGATSLSPVATLTNAVYSGVSGLSPITGISVADVVGTNPVSAATVAAATPAGTFADGAKTIATADYTAVDGGTHTAIYPGTVTLSWDEAGALSAAGINLADSVGKTISAPVTFTLVD